MFSEILKIIPKLDAKDLQNMEKALQSRFTKVAKGFGKGLVGAVKGGGIIGVALGLIDKLLNPLKEVQDAIDKSMKQGDDIVTYAKQFNTTSGKLTKLVSLGKATGLDPDNLYRLIEKFQGAVAGYNLNPKDPANSSVANFAKIPDTADAFFQFIQSLKKATTEQQVLIQSQVFGEKQILKMSDFLQSDFVELYKKVGLDKVSSKKLSIAQNKLGGLNDMTEELGAKRDWKDVLAKAGIINAGMVKAKDESDRIALQRENQRIQSYENLAAISQTVDKMMILVEEGISMVGKLIVLLTPFCNKVMAFIDSAMKSSWFRNISKFLGGKGD